MKILYPLSLILLLTISNLFAFDGKREGFIFGGGIGSGHLSQSTESNIVFLTNFKIGYAPSNTLEIFYISKVSWWGASDGDLVILGLGAVAATFYLDNTSETGWFASGGIGYSNSGRPLGNGNSDFGLGFFGGGGYEFAPHWSVEVDLLHSTIEKSISSFGVLVSINVLGF